MFGQTPGNALLDGLGHRGLGLVSGYLGGKFDITGQHLMEILQAFPDLILAMAISMAIGTGMRAVIMATAVARILFGGRVI
jgi:peptide/nickel transport system permease protein